MYKVMWAKISSSLSCNCEDQVTRVTYVTWQFDCDFMRSCAHVMQALRNCSHITLRAHSLHYSLHAHGCMYTYTIVIIRQRPTRWRRRTYSWINSWANGVPNYLMGGKASKHLFCVSIHIHGNVLRILPGIPWISLVIHMLWGFFSGEALTVHAWL
jgi:hypothetical protein